MPLPDIIEFIGTDVTQGKFKEAQNKLLEYIGGEVPTKNELNVAVNVKANQAYVDAALAGFQNGALKTYPSLAAANADIANIALNNKVEVLSEAEGGSYYKATAGANSLTKSPYDPKNQAVSEAKEYVDIKTSSLVKNREKNTHTFVDADDNIVAAIEGDGSLILVGLDKSVQQEIIEQKQVLKSKNYSDVFFIIDADDNIVLKIDKDGKLWICGLEKDVASTINEKGNGTGALDTSNLANYSYRDTFIPKAECLLNFFRNTQNTGLLAPVPLSSFEQNFTISNSWLGSANISDWGNYIPIETPYGTDRGVVHPHILEIPNKFMGFRYLLTITGYTNGLTEEENPFLVGSNDLHNFELLTGLIDMPDSFTWEYGTVACSDPFTFYDIKTGELVVLYRFYWSVSDSANANKYKEIIYCKRTKDGKTWSEREVFHEPPGTSMFMSPAVLFDAKTETYHMYGVAYSLDGTKRVIRHLSSKTCKNDWVEIGDIPSPAGTAIWHVDLKHVGDKQICVFQNRLGNASVGFRTGISSNFHDFEWQSDWWNPQTHGVYKASFLPQFNAQNQMRLVYLWTTNQTPLDTNLKYKLFIQPTPYLNVEFLEK